MEIVVARTQAIVLKAKATRLSERVDIFLGRVGGLGLEVKYQEHKRRRGRANTPYGPYPYVSLLSYFWINPGFSNPRKVEM